MKTKESGQPREPVPVTAIFIACLKVSLYGIGGGGGLVWARRIAVEQQRWISEQDFADLSYRESGNPPRHIYLHFCVADQRHALNLRFAKDV